MISFESVIRKVFGTPSDRWIKKQQPMITRIGDLEKGMKARQAAERGQV